MTETVAPTWLVAALDQRLALMEANGVASVDPEVIVMTPLTEPEPGATAEDRERWERACDNCGKYTPAGDAFFTGNVERRFTTGVRVVVTFGCCADCKGAG